MPEPIEKMSNFISKRHITRVTLFLRGWAFVWGLLVAWPWTDVFPTSPAYITLQASGLPEWLYGGVFFLLSLFGVSARLRVRQATMGALAVLWLALALSFLASYWQLLGWGVLGFWLYLGFFWLALTEVFYIDMRWHDRGPRQL